MGKFGLLGQSLGHSHSPAIHRLLGSWPYQLFEREPEDLERFLLEENWDGVNVTMPYKKAVVPYCKELSPLAQKLGSVNTLVKQADGTIYADNTDYYGFQQMALGLGIDYREKKALVLGSGGASVTVQAVLQELGCRVTVISRNGPDNYENLERHRDAAVVVNATPVGMYPNNGESPVSLMEFPALEAVLDLVYNPLRTKLILEAEALGIPHTSGLPMLISQGARASEQFTGRVISPEMLEFAWKQTVLSIENLVLIGMPGSGKSTIGRMLADATGKTFVDTDQEVEKIIGMSIADFLREKNEAAFRSVETAVLKHLCKQSGLVIATGGGCVCREENYALLHQNSKIIWLRRALDKLPVFGRPLSLRDGIQAIFSARKAQYQRFSDVEVSNDGTLEATLEQILEAISK